MLYSVGSGVNSESPGCCIVVMLCGDSGVAFSEVVLRVDILYVIYDV